MTTCWRCGEPTGRELFCGSCKSLQPADSDFYRFFGLEPRLTLDLADLQKRFYALSRQLHPDLYTRKSERERQYSLEATSVLNDAYRTLRDPVARAEYVLERNGLAIGDKRSGGERANQVPPELLEEVFELNLALEEMRTGDASARPQLEEARAKFSGLLEESGRQLATLGAAWDAGGGAGTLGQIRGVLDRRRYIRNLVREVEKELNQRNVHVSD